ncbi:hypothetical protein GCM10027299_50770 [Larkinella ripae]
MKTFLCISLVGLLSTGFLRAQTNAYYRADPSDRRAYWEVTTDYKTNGTAIRYFNADRQLLYQETLPKQLVKLTKRNVRRLDEALVKVTQNQPQPSHVRSVSLPANTENPRIARERLRVMDAERKASPADLMARIVPAADGFDAYITLFLYNPKQERVRIEVLNSKGYVVAQEYNNRLQCTYRFRMGNMPMGDYRVQISKVWETKPTFSDLITLSYQPSQVLITTKSKTAGDTNGLVAK